MCIAMHSVTDRQMTTDLVRVDRTASMLAVGLRSAKNCVVIYSYNHDRKLMRAMLRPYVPVPQKRTSIGLLLF